MKTILVTSFHVLISRNILASPVLDILRRDPNLRVVLVVPEKKREFFEREFGGPNVFVHPTPKRLSWRDGVFREVGLAAVRTRAALLRRRRGIRIEFPRLQKFLFIAPLLRPFLPFFYRLVMPWRSFADIFERWRPSLVFATDLYASPDLRLLHEAKLRGIPTVGMVRSWDNLTNLGALRVIPDVVVVHNEIIKNDAVTLSGISPRRIRVVGIPHYDRYLPASSRSREALARTLDLDAAKRWVVYAPIGNLHTAGTIDRDTIERVSRLLPPTHQLLVRLRPADDVRLDGLASLPNVVFHRPGRRFGSLPSLMENELTPEDDEILVATLFHCNLLVAQLTTLIIDAALFDKPVILVKDERYPDTVGYFSDEHVQPVLSSGGVRIARNDAELAAAVDSYLRDSSQDADGRKRIVEEQCGRVDGRSSERLVAVLRERLA